MNKIAISAVMLTLCLGFLFPKMHETKQAGANQFEDLRHVAQVDPLESKATDLLDQSENFDTVVAAVRTNAAAIDKLNAELQAVKGLAANSTTTTSNGAVTTEIVERSSSGGSTGNFAVSNSYGSTGSAQYAPSYGSTGSSQYQTVAYSYPTYSTQTYSNVPMTPASTPVSAGQVCVNGVCTVAPSAAPQGFFARLRSARRY